MKSKNFLAVWTSKTIRHIKSFLSSFDETNYTSSRVTKQPTSTYLLRKEGENMTYSKVETFNIDGCKVRVHFPDLPEEERAKRKNALMKAAERFLKHAERVKKGES